MAKRQGVITEDIHLTITKDFINQNNKIFELLEKCEFKFFGNNDQKKYKEYQVMNNPKISKLGITAHFWDELLYYDNNIKYNSIGLKAIKTVYEYIKQIIECEKTKIVDIPNIHIPEFKTRIKQNLINNHLKTEPEAEKIAIEFVTLKSNFIKETLINAIEGEDSKTKKNDLKTLTSTSTSKSKKK